jgi:quercetin dioxygenase-like cupin family protein
MDRPDFPELITSLPEADLPIAGARAWISQSSDHQVVFFEIEAGVEVPLHSHGAQWGIVVEGEIELTVGDETKVRRPGDSYVIPAGVLHGGKILSRFRAIDVFEEPDRYAPKSV